MRLVLYQPDIPQNTGAILRLGACMGIPVDVVEPCGFALSDVRMRRAGMDYLERANLVRHASWHAYLAARPPGRLILLTTAGETAPAAFRFAPDDSLLLGRESSGVPADIHAGSEARLRVPMREGARSLNVAIAAAMVLAEALRQTNTFP